MNYVLMAQALRDIADKLDPKSKKPVGNPVRDKDNESTLRDELPENEWGQYRVLMPFGKYYGDLLLDIPVSYFKYLGDNDFKSSGNNAGNAVRRAIDFLTNPDSLKLPPMPPLPPVPVQKRLDVEDDLEEDIPF